MILSKIERAERLRKVARRHSRWMDRHWGVDAKDKFTWTEEKMERLFAVNDAIIEKENALYHLLENVKADIDGLLAAGHSYYEAYDIDAYLSYEAEEYATSTGDEETMFAVYAATDFEYCNGMYTAAGRPLGTLEEELSRDTNYNWEWPFRAVPDREHYITRFLCKLLEQGTYTPEDVLYLNPDYFVPCIEIRN